MAICKTVLCEGFLVSNTGSFTFLLTASFASYRFPFVISQSFSVSSSPSVQCPVLFPVALNVLLRPLSVSTLSLHSSQVAHFTPSPCHLLLLCLLFYASIIFCAISQNTECVNGAQCQMKTGICNTCSVCITFYIKNDTYTQINGCMPYRSCCLSYIFLSVCCSSALIRTSVSMHV